jgi:glucose-6-phosphate isomerase
MSNNNNTEKLSLDITVSSINSEQLYGWKTKVIDAHQKLHEGTGVGSDYLGWRDLPQNYDKEEFARIKSIAEKIRTDSDVLVVIGIGGSYLGARAVIEALPTDKKMEIYFAGNNLSSIDINSLFTKIEGKDVSLNIISKSGTTTEPAVAFRFLKDWMEKKYGDKANERIYATTDKEKGSLKQLSTEKGYQTFVVPNDIGGRYSILTAVGLLPIAVAGINIDKLMDGAKVSMEDFANQDLAENDCYKYAVSRNILYSQGKVIEILPKKGKVKVEGVHIVTRHVKARAQGQKSGRIQQEAFIDISNISLVDKSKKERTTSKKSKDQE